MERARKVIRRAIDESRGRLPFLFGLAALVFIPLGLLEAVESIDGGIDTDEQGGLALAAALATAAVHVVTAVLGGILYTGAVALVVVRTDADPDVSLRSLVRETRWAALIAIDLLFAVGVLFGILLFLIPGAIFFARYALVAVVAEIEDLGVRDSFRRSAKLTEGSRMLVLVLILGAFLVGDAIGAGIKALLTDTFLVDWLAASAVEVLVNPAVALLTVALVLELGGRVPRSEEPA